MRKLLVLVSTLFIAAITVAADYEITPYNDYKPDVIGKQYRFKEPLTYLVLKDSPPGFLEKNNNIGRILTTEAMATGNDAHVKELVDINTVFEVVSIFYVKDLSPPPDDWSDTEKEQYLAWLETVQEVLNIMFELRDENGVFSTVTAISFSKAYDVTDDRDLIVRDYTYDLTPNVKDQIIQYGKRFSDDIPENENEFSRFVTNVVSPQIMLKFTGGISTTCSVGITTHCSGIYNVHEILSCLKQHEDQVSQTCNNSLTSVFDSEPLQSQTLYNDIVLPAGATYFYGYDPEGGTPTPMGAIIPDGLTAQSNDLEYGPGRLGIYRGIVSEGTLSRPQLIKGILFKGFVEYHHGLTAIRNATLAENTSIQGINYMGDTKISFRETGQVLSGILAVNQTIENIDIPAGYSIFFDDDGVLFSIGDLNGNPLDGFQSKSSMMN